MKHQPASIDHIVIFRALQLGDMLCTVPAFRALRTAYPQAEITLVGLPWAESFVSRFSHYLDGFIPFPGWPGLPEQEAHLEQIPVFLQEVQSRKFDLAIQMQGAGTVSNPLTAAFGARKTAGFYLSGEYGEDHPGFFPYPHGEHEIRIFLHLMRRLGIPDAGEALEFPVSEAERLAFERAREAFAIGSEYVVLHPGARMAKRRLPTDVFSRVGDALAGMGMRVVVTGSAAECELTRQVVKNMRHPAVDTGGQTDLGGLALLIENARVLISNDTGVSHIAAATQTPSVILFTASDPHRWQPLDHQLHRGVLNALDAPVDEIISEAMSFFQKAGNYARQS